MVDKIDRSIPKLNPMDLYLARTVNYGICHGRTREQLINYLNRIQQSKTQHTQEKAMQQPKWFYIDDPHNLEYHYVRISEIESIGYVGWKNNNPDNAKVIIRTKSGNEFILRQEWGEKGQLLGDLYDTFADYVKTLEIEE